MQDFNELTNEYGKGADEFTNQIELDNLSENGEPKEDFQSEEYPSGQEKSTKKTKPTLSDVLKTAAMVLATTAVVGGSTGVLPSVSGGANQASAEIVNIYWEDSWVSYYVETEGEGEFFAVLKNPSTHREVELWENASEGVFEELKAGLEYTLAVVQKQAFGEKVLAEKKFKTLKEPYYEPFTWFYGIITEGVIADDGKLYFSLDFVDENGYYSDFSAYIEDDMGRRVDCVLTGDLHAEQSIDVVTFDIVGPIARLVVNYYTTENGERELVTLTQDIEIN